MSATQTKEKVGLRVFMTSARGNYDAIGIFDGKGITILKNSIVSPTVTHDRVDTGKRAAMLTPDGVLKEDTYFASPSAAALFVCGRSANGWVEWKTASGEPLQNFRERTDNTKTADLAGDQVISDLTLKGTKQENDTRKRLLKRIYKGLEKKFFLGDIAISDQDYELLRKDAKQISEAIVKAGHAAAESVTLAITLVQIGIRQYDGRYFWPYVETELGIERSLKTQQLLGETFVNTLRTYKKYITDASERVQNILFHGFVSNYYSHGVFELLFQYYVRDLERDIYRNTPEQMQALMDTLATKASLDEQQSEAFADQFMTKGTRAYKLKRHTLQAISVHPVHSRTRLRRILRLIDRAFWNNALPKNPTSRLTILFKEWVEDSPTYKKEYRLYQLGEIRNRGKKHFSTPYLFARIDTGCFMLKLPAQIVAEQFIEDLKWEITTNARSFRLDADTYPVLTGYKTEEANTSLSPKELFGDIQCALVCGEQTVRKFPVLPQSTVRFFDMEGDYAARLFRIPMCAYTLAENALYSGALLSQVSYGDITRWDFEFQQGDLVVLPDGTGMIVGDRYTDGLVPRGKVPYAQYSGKNNTLPIYAIAPELLLTLPKGKLSGTVLYCNDVRYRLTDCQYAEVENRDTYGIQAILLPLSQFDFCKEDGIKNIILDVPGAYYDKPYSFVLLKDFAVEFPGAPYVFQTRGTVRFPRHIQVSGEYEKLPGENGYQFTLHGMNPELHITVNRDIPVLLQIPMLLWSTDREKWSVQPAGELWHTDFFKLRKLFFRSPFGKVSVFTDSDVDDEDDDTHMITAESGADGIYTVDMTRFRSWLTRGVIKNDILLKLNGEEYQFATVYTGSLVASYKIDADYERGTLIWTSTILGKADYYLDVVHVASGKVLADKKQIIGKRLVLKDHLSSGVYKFTLYEAEEDDSGFDDLIYEQLLHTERMLKNPDDFDHMKLEVRSFRVTDRSSLYTYFKEKYMIVNLKRIGQDTFRGRLMVDEKPTGLAVTVKLSTSGDWRYFRMAAINEADGMDFRLMYDSKCGTLVLPPLTKRDSEEHRYGELAYERIVYLGLLHEKRIDMKTVVATGQDKTPETANRAYSGNDLLSVSKLGLSVRIRQILTNAGMKKLGDLARVPGDQWFRIPGVGTREYMEIAAAVSKYGVFLRSPFGGKKSKK